ncbi:MAG TPA: hypothetical protein VMY87_11540 [Armatimonadota bacterium]|nr:hypothetical protein [Armatimonadota bacterium]
MGEGGNGGLRVHFDARVRPEFQGAKVTSDAGGAMLRPGQVPSAHDPKELLEPVVVRYRDSGLRK